MSFKSAYFLRSYRLQNLLVEFASLKQIQPQGIYVSLTQGDPTLWSGVLFVRKGPYAPAVFRFKIRFTVDFPLAPPLITFNADIFHPLLAPLTTATYTSARSESDTISEETLPPGAFSLRHGFPQWYERSESPSRSNSPSKRALDLNLSGDKTHDELENLHVVDLLRYIRFCFEDESMLDAVPFEAAGNRGAWYAWQAHRAKKFTKSRQMTTPNEHSISGKSEGASGETALKRRSQPPAPKRPSEWNWEGVWEERVKRAVQGSLTEPVLYGGAGALRDDDQIQFMHTAPEEFESIRSTMHQNLT